MPNFTYNGKTYIVDSAGKVLDTQGQPLAPNVANDPKLQAAAAQATQANNRGAAAAGSGLGTLDDYLTGAGATTTAAPSQATVAATRASNAPGSDTLTNPLGTGNAAAPAAATTATTATPTTTTAAPATSGPGSATELRNRRDQLQAQLDALQATIDKRAGTGDEGPTNAETSQLNSLRNSVTTMTSDITTAEARTPPTPAKTTLGTPTEKNKYILQEDNAGVVHAVNNPAWDGSPPANSYTTEKVGNNLYTFNTGTGEVKLAYTDTDASGLAAAQQKVADKNAETERLKANATTAADAARVEIEQAVARGEDAASVRAQKTLELSQAYQQWQMSDGDRKAAQGELDDYNVERHRTAADEMTAKDYAEKVRQNQATEAYNQQKLEADKQNAALTSATSLRNTDVTAASSRYSTDTTALTARMNAANALLQAGMTQLGDINKYLPPGSDLAGKALEGLMAYGQKFLANAAGPAPTEAATPDMSTYMQQLGASQAGQQQAQANQLQANTAALNQDTTATAQPATPPPPTDTTGTGFTKQTIPGIDLSAMPGGNALGSQSTPLPSTAGVPSTWGQGTGTNFNNPGGGPNASAMLGLFNNADPAQAMFEQNTAQHQKNMQAGLSPDGSPFASPADVAKIFGRGSS